MRTCAEFPSHLVLVTRPPQAGTGGAPSQLGGLQAADAGLHWGRAREAGRVGGRGMSGGGATPCTLSLS